MEYHPHAVCIDLALFSDEELIHRLRANYFDLLLQEMVRRHYGTLCRLIAERAPLYGLRHEKQEDAEDTALVALEYALHAFRHVHAKTGRPVLFQEYLKWVLMRRLRNFVRDMRRRQQVFRYSLSDDPTLQAAKRTIRCVICCPNPTDPSQSDPAILAERKEVRARMQASVDRLGGPASDMLEGVGEGATLLILAVRMRRSYRTVLRWWEKICKRLRDEWQSLK